MTDWKAEYLKMKKQYLDLKKQYQRKLAQNGGNNSDLGNITPNYLKYGPTDGSLVDSDEQVKQTIKSLLSSNNVNEEQEGGNGNNLIDIKLDSEMDKILTINDPSIPLTEDIMKNL